jgi:hypothetical protein
MLDWGSVVLGFGAGMVVMELVSMALDRYLKEEAKPASLEEADELKRHKVLYDRLGEL